MDSSSPQSKPSPTDENPTTPEPSLTPNLTPSPSSETKPPPSPHPNAKTKSKNPSVRSKRKTKAAPLSSSSASSPRKTRRARKRPEKGIELVPIEEEDVAERPKKRRQKNKQAQELGLVVHDPYSTVMKENVGENNMLEAIMELIMWKNVAKSTLWFGSGSMFFLSSWFSVDSDFSIISAASQVGMLILGVAFFRDSLPQRQQLERRDAKFRLTEDDFVRAARLILPTANAVLATWEMIFSGQPTMTLKVAPVLLLTAKYGHLMTPWRLLGTGFLLSFTLPKLYSSYSMKIHQQVKKVESSLKEAWKSCPRKKLIATSTVMLAWNLLSVRMRIFTAFMSMVILRHKKQQTGGVNNEIVRE